ncbi:MAG: DUF3185 family protein [Halofilum sp. (in: g-proteobacteria)]|nr:DUF3185 family protein [Halofilum sp. (in: g-proteobacteria)]
MKTGISFALLAVGILLFIWGVSVSQSAGSEMSRLFTGEPTDKAIWLLIGGAGVAIAGLFGVLRGKAN